MILIDKYTVLYIDSAKLVFIHVVCNGVIIAESNAVLTFCICNP